MKTNMSFRAKRRNLFLILVIAAIVSCEKANVADVLMGQQPSEEQLDAPLCIAFNVENIVDNSFELNLKSGDKQFITLFLQSNHALQVSELITVSVDESLAGKADILPQSFYKITNGGSIILSSGKTLSEKVEVEIMTEIDGNTLPNGKYVIPIVAKSSTQAIKNSTKFIWINVNTQTFNRPELYIGEDCFTVFYLNTGIFDPRLATDFVVSKMSPMFETIWNSSIGNILNLRMVTINYSEDSNRALLNLSSDMRYICDNFRTYIRPIQDTGRKVCICIEGANKGIGFCNLTDEQIADFAGQVKQLIDQYGFDGVNLWDRNSGYGMDGKPAMNTISYPKLIRTLRSMLGPDKLITVTDYGEPTESFWSSELSGGIEVGKLIDYAWSGYVNGNEPIQIIDPYHQGAPNVSVKYPRKPIIGLDPKRYGCVHTTWYRFEDCGYDAVAQWVEDGYKQNNISVYYDIRSNLQDRFEGQIYTPQELLQYLDNNINVYMFDVRNFNGYGKWLKDW